MVSSEEILSTAIVIHNNSYYSDNSITNGNLKRLPLAEPSYISDGLFLKV